MVRGLQVVREQWGMKPVLTFLFQPSDLLVQVLNSTKQTCLGVLGINCRYSVRRSAGLDDGVIGSH